MDRLKNLTTAIIRGCLTRLTPEESGPVDCSSPVVDVKKYVVNPLTHVKELKVVGHRNIQDEISEAAKGVSLSDILARNTAQAVAAASSVAPAIYGDSASLPKGGDPNEISRARAAALKSFNQLPADLRAQFNNSVDEFASKFTSELLNQYVNSKARVAAPSASDSKEIK